MHSDLVFLRVFIILICLVTLLYWTERVNTQRRNEYMSWNHFFHGHIRRETIKRKWHSCTDHVRIEDFLHMFCRWTIWYWQNSDLILRTELMLRFRLLWILANWLLLLVVCIYRIALIHIPHFMTLGTCRHNCRRLI